MPKHVFIITVGRTGSTLLLNLLNRDPNFVLSGERGDFFAEMLEKYQEGLIKSNFPDLPFKVENRFRKDKQAWISYRSKSFYIEKSKELIKSFIYPPEIDNNKVYGAKLIRLNTHEKILNLLEIFPESKIIFLYRNLDDIIKSGWWKESEREVLSKRLDIFRHIALMKPDICFEINYEEIVSENLTSIRKMLNFIGSTLSDSEIKETIKNKLQDPLNFKKMMEEIKKI